MTRRLIALLFCLLAEGALAQCVAANSAAPQPGAVSQPVRANAAAQPPARAELIKTAAAGTTDEAPPAVRSTPRAGEVQDHPRRGGTAMLLAALALMSGIALRRYGANNS